MRQDWSIKKYPSLNNRTVQGLFILLCVASLVGACSIFVKPRGPALTQLSSAQVKSNLWTDDSSHESLASSVERSVQYYQQLPSSKSFNYGELSYTPEEMIASMHLFLQTVKNYHGKEQARELRRKFLIFESRNTEGRAFFTGYYEPLLDGSPEPDEEYSEPVYKTPDDLIEVDLGLFAEQWSNMKIVGRNEGNTLLPYDSRDDIVYGMSLDGRAEPLAYVKEIELFFLQIQGSGLIRFSDGRIKRINYAQKNGHPYRAIGELLRETIPPEEMSLQAIRTYLYSHPDEVRGILSYNQSYTFFREVEDGPLGDIEVPLTPGRSIAMDRQAAPRGGLAFVKTEVPAFKDGLITGWQPFQRFVVVQDTGGAIRDHGRADIFFGHGNEAELKAGHLKQEGRLFLIVAKKEYLNQTVKSTQ